MCGRYAASAGAGELVEEFEIEADESGGGLAPDYNVAPTKQAPVVLTRVPSGQRHEEGAAPVRQLRILTWGLVPSWSRSADSGARMINARVETLFDKPAFRRAAAARRALVPAEGWYEWMRQPESPARAPKQPFVMRRRDGALVALAGVYEFWRDDSRAADDPQAWLTTFAVLTTKAEPGLAHIHDRMPLVLEPDTWTQWLDPARTEPDEVRPLLETAAPGRFSATAVSPTVGSPASNGPQLLEPVDPDLVDASTGELGEPLPGL